MDSPHAHVCFSRQAGQRVGGYLSAIVPLIMHFVQLDEESGDDELRESCLQAFEAFVLRCFREITPHVQGVREYVCATIIYGEVFEFIK